MIFNNAYRLYIIECDEFLYIVNNHIKALLHEQKLEEIKKLADDIHNFPRNAIIELFNKPYYGLVNIENYLEKFPNKIIYEKWNKIKSLVKKLQ